MIADLHPTPKRPITVHLGSLRKVSECPFSAVLAV